MRKMMVSSLLVILGLGLVGAARADGLFEVTVTNLTRGQVFSAPVVATHNDSFELFELGQPASAELAALAEDGLTDPLTAVLNTDPNVYDWAVGAGNVVPGGSITIQVHANGMSRYLSVAGMLVTTNDTFFAVSGLGLVATGEARTTALGYDAGSEGNSELCEHIPGPPCGNGGVHNGDGAEGYVHVNAGIHGIGDLDPSVNDWRNPVALVTVKRIG